MSNPNLDLHKLEPNPPTTPLKIDRVLRRIPQHRVTGDAARHLLPMIRKLYPIINEIILPTLSALEQRLVELSGLEDASQTVRSD